MSMSGVEIGALGILVSTMVWYLKSQTKRDAKREKDALLERNKLQERRDKDQKEERDYYRGIVKDDLRKNVELNVKGITLQKEMIKDFEIHNGHIVNFQKKAVESLGLICDRLNGGNKIKKVGKRLKEKIK